MENGRVFNIEDIDLLGLVKYVIKNSGLILLLAFSSALLSSVYLNVTYQPRFSTKVTFAASSKIQAYGTLDTLESNIDLATTFQPLLQSSILKDKIAEDLGRDSIDCSITTNIVSNTNIMTLTVTAMTPEDTYRIMQSLLRCYPNIAQKVLGNARLQVLDYPAVPYNPINQLYIRGMQKKVFLATIAIVIILLGGAYCFRDTVMTEKGAKRNIDGLFLGQIPVEKKNKTWKTKIHRTNKGILITNPGASFSFTQNFQKIATGISIKMKKHNMKSLMITSGTEREGRTTIAVNLALCLAAEGKRILLVDGDIRKPSIYKYFSYEKEEVKNYSDVLTGKEKTDQLKIYTSKHIKNLYLLMNCSSSEDSDTFFENNKMKKLLECCSKNVDFIIMDMPPMTGMVDTEEMANIVDASILVVHKDKSKVRQINDCIDLLEKRNAQFLGYILNEVNQFTLKKSHCYINKIGTNQKNVEEERV